MPLLPLTKEQKIITLTKRVQAADRYTALNDNEDFQFWKASQADLRLKQLELGILEIDRSQSAWQEKAVALIAAYQETKRTFDSCFKQWQVIGEKARKELKELKKDEK